MADADSHLWGMSDMKKVKTALIAWAKRLLGVSKHFILWSFADVGADIWALGENESHSEEIDGACLQRLMTHQDSGRQFIL